MKTISIYIGKNASPQDAELMREYCKTKKIYNENLCLIRKTKKGQKCNGNVGLALSVDIWYHKLLEEVEGVYISANSVYASNDAVANTQIKIVAIVNGVESNVLILTIVDAPPA